MPKPSKVLIIGSGLSHITEYSLGLATLPSARLSKLVIPKQAQTKGQPLKLSLFPLELALPTTERTLGCMCLHRNIMLPQQN